MLRHLNKSGPFLRGVEHPQHQVTSVGSRYQRVLRSLLQLSKYGNGPFTLSPHIRPFWLECLLQPCPSTRQHQLTHCQHQLLNVPGQLAPDAVLDGLPGNLQILVKDCGVKAGERPRHKPHWHGPQAGEMEASAFVGEQTPLCTLGALRGRDYCLLGVWLARGRRASGCSQ